MPQSTDFILPEGDAISAGRTPGADRFVEDATQLPDLVGLDSPAIRAQLGGLNLRELSATKRALDEQPKVRVRLPQRAPDKEQLPPVSVQINDYTYRISRGQSVVVPEEVGRILEESGYLNFG